MKRFAWQRVASDVVSLRSASGAAFMSKTSDGKDNRLQLEMLSQMIEEISGELALEPLLQRIVMRACELIGADDGVISLYVPERDAIRTASTHNIPVHELRTELSRGEGLTGRVLELDQPVRCYYHELPHPTRENPPAGMHSLGVPIRARGRLVGVFGISTYAPRVLDEDSQEFLTLFARHAAVAIDNAQRYSAEKRRASRLALIARVSAIIASNTDLTTLLQRAADAIHDTLQYPNIDIALLDPQDATILVVLVRGGDYKRLVPHDVRLPIDCGIMGAAIREQRSQLVNDIANDQGYIAPPHVSPPQAELAVPIIYGEKALGVLNIEGDLPFDELDRVSLEIVAEHLGVAIVNAQLFKRATEAAVLEERQRLARDLHDSVMQILSSMSLIAQSLTEAWHREPAEGERRAVRLSELSRIAFSEMRGLLHELSPRAALSPNYAASHSLPDRLRRLLTAMWPAYIQLQIDMAGFQPQAITHEDTLLRVCQEAVSNAIRHASPSTIRIETLLSASGVRLSITDDGCGISRSMAQGMGIGNMRARLSELGGQLRIASSRTRGTRILAYLPRCDRPQP